MSEPTRTPDAACVDRPESVESSHRGKEAPRGVNHRGRDTTEVAAKRTTPAKLTKIGAIGIDSLNELAAQAAAGEAVPNHTPAAPKFWFHGLAREVTGIFKSPGMLAHLSDDAVLLARDVLGCSCKEANFEWRFLDPDNVPAKLAYTRFGEEPEIVPDICYACAFDAHGMCIHGCKADIEALASLDSEIAARGLLVAA